MRTSYLNSYNEKRDDTNSYTIIIVHMIFMFMPIYLSTLFEDLLVVFFFFIWFSIFSNGIINLMHECAHRLVFKKRYHCDIFGKWVLAPLLFTDLILTEIDIGFIIINSEPIMIQRKLT